MTDVANDGRDVAGAIPPGAPDLAAPRIGSDYARRLARRRFINDMPDKGLFGFVAVFGFVMVVGLKLFGISADAVAVIAVLLMLGYGLLAYRISEVQLRLDRLGDNFYYLGFIFTLASMSAALLQLRDNPNNIEAVLGSFGIALFTTIVGVAGRVTFAQMRSEIDEVEAEVRRDLVEASDALRAQLSQTLREFETFSTAIRQAEEERLAQSADAARKQMDLIATVAQSAASEIQSAFAANRSSAKEMSQAVQNAGQAVQLMVERVSSLEMPTARLDQQMAGFGQGLGALLTRLAQAIDEVGRASASSRFRPARKRPWWPFGR
jgi:hypothetical protein